MADIATLAIKLTANPTSFEAGLAAASASASNFASGVVGRFQSMASGVNQALMAIATNPVGLAIVAIGAAVSAVYVLQNRLNALTTEIMVLGAEGEKYSNQQASLARRFGLSMGAAAGLQLQFRMLRLDMDTGRAAMQAFGINVQRAAAGTTETTRALARLGINAQDLARMPMTEQMRTLARGLSQVADRGQRAQLMLAILGRRGMALEPILSGGVAWMDAAAAQSARWGLTQTEAGAAAIRAMTIARGTASEATASLRTGIALAVAAALAPLQRFYYEIRTGIIELMQGPFSELRATIRGLGEVSQAVVEGIKVGWTILQPVFVGLGAEVAQLYQEFKDVFGITGDWQNTVRVLAAVLVTSLGPVITLVGSWVVNFGRLIVWMIGIIRDSINNLLAITRIAVEAMGARILGLLDLAARIPGVAGGLAAASAVLVRNQLAELRGALAFELPVLGAIGIAAIPPRDLDAQERLNELLRTRERILRGIESPLERINQELADIYELFAAGELNLDQFALAVDRATAGLNARGNQVQLARGLTAGSAEAISLVNQTMASGASDPIDRLRVVAEEQRELQRQQLRNGQAIVDAIQNNQLNLEPI